MLHHCTIHAELAGTDDNNARACFQIFNLLMPAFGFVDVKVESADNAFVIGNALQRTPQLVGLLFRAANNDQNSLMSSS